MKHRKVISFLVPLCIFVMLGCAAQNQYSANLTIESEITALMEQYNVWYELAPAEVQEEWRKTFDPAFEEINLMLDTYHNLLANDMSTQSIILEINQLKTRIMMELVKRRANEG